MVFRAVLEPFELQIRTSRCPRFCESHASGGKSAADCPIMNFGKRIGLGSVAAVLLVFAGQGISGGTAPLAVSPHLYEVEIRLLRDIGAESDALELLRRQFRIVQHREPLRVVGFLAHTPSRAPFGPFTRC